MPSDNFFTYVTDAITQLLTTHSDLFIALGANLFKGFAIILLAWFGIKSALSGRGFSMDRFASLLMTIAFGYAMVTFYSRPIPGFGLSFHNLITKQASSLSNQIESGSTEEVGRRLAEAYSSMEQPSGPSLLDIMQVIRYVVIILALSTAEFVLLGVIAFGLVSEAVCVLVGPIFIPFFVVPNLEWLFWGWFKAFIQYAFYPVVANAFIFVFGEMLIHFLDSHLSPWNAQTIAALFVQLVFLLIAFIWGLLKVPSLVNSIFAGRSGESALPGLLSRF
jgi:hypothetical protein